MVCGKVNKHGLADKSYCILTLCEPADKPVIVNGEVALSVKGAPSKE